MPLFNSANNLGSLVTVSSTVDSRWVYGHLISNKQIESSDGSLILPSGEAPSHGSEGFMTNPQRLTVLPE